MEKLKIICTIWKFYKWEKIFPDDIGASHLCVGLCVTERQKEMGGWVGNPFLFWGYVGLINFGYLKFQIANYLIFHTMNYYYILMTQFADVSYMGLTPQLGVQLWEQHSPFLIALWSLIMIFKAICESTHTDIHKQTRTIQHLHPRMKTEILKHGFSTCS